MEIQINATPWHQADADWLIVGIADSGKMTGALSTLDEALSGQLTRLRESNDLTGKLAELLAIRDAQGISAQRLMLVGLGNIGELTAAGFDKAMMSAFRQVSSKKDTAIAVTLPSFDDCSLSLQQCASSTAAAAQIGCVGQDLYRAEAGRFPFESVKFLCAENGGTQPLRDAIDQGTILGEAVNVTRELVNRMPQEIFPASFAERAEELASQFGLSCEILDEDRLNDEKMGSLLAVAVGSNQPPRVVVLEHRGDDDDAPTLALVGKGVTFDSGGLSLKTSDGMKTMKCDMAGAATVMGAMTAIARLNLPVNVTGYMGLVENMPSGSSYKLGDVLTARNGVTIEVLNTDAEGRLVLADVLSYAVDKGAAKLIDLATLTGACVVALGEDVTGVFSNDQTWCDDVLAAASRSGEHAWQLPMFDLYADLIKGDVADINNIGGRWGGAITAAKFLERFVSETPWVHLDIAGPSFASSNKSHREGGATGCMVRTLVDAASAFGAE